MITENEYLINTTKDLRSRSSTKVNVSSTTGYGTMTGFATSTSRSGKTTSTWWRTEEGGSWWRTEDGEETGLAVLLQVMFPFLMAGVGMVCAGFVFDFIVAWPVFVEITEIIIMIPALLGLKGNLEMTLAARLSTASNLGKLDVLETAVSLVLGNLALLQCQGVVLGFLVAGQAVLVGLIGQDEDQPFSLDHAIILLSSSILTASIASLGLGAIMASVIIAARRLDINPDNMAIPIAEALGDITSLGLLAVLASCLHVEVAEQKYTAYVIMGCYAVVAPVCGYIAWRNSHTRPVMVGGWIPILAAMTISFVAGVILEPAVLQFVIFKQFQTVFNGVGGQLASIQASRISTALHSAEIQGKRKCGLQDDKEAMGGVTSPPPSYASPQPSQEGADPSMTSPPPSYASPQPSQGGADPSITSPQPSYASPQPSQGGANRSMTSPPPSYDSPQPSQEGADPSMTSPPPSYTSPQPSQGGADPSMTSPPPSYASPQPSKGDAVPSMASTSPPYEGPLPSYTSPPPSYTSLQDLSPFKSNINTSTPIRRSLPEIFPNEISQMSSGASGDSKTNHNQLFCCSSSSDSSTGRLLLLLVLPGQCLFLYLFVLLKNERSPTSLFVALFLLASFIQVSLLIQISQMMVHWFWSKGWDPDSSAIPYITALGDLLGVSLLSATCFLLQWLGDEYVLGGGAGNGNQDYENITTTTGLGYYATNDSIDYNFSHMTIK